MVAGCHYTDILFCIYDLVVKGDETMANEMSGTRITSLMKQQSVMIH
jgi:hypothetical protein